MVDIQVFLSLTKHQVHTGCNYGVSSDPRYTPLQPQYIPKTPWESLGAGWYHGWRKRDDDACYTQLFDGVMIGYHTVLHPNLKDYVNRMGDPAIGNPPAIFPKITGTIKYGRFMLINIQYGSTSIQVPWTYIAEIRTSFRSQNKTYVSQQLFHTEYVSQTKYSGSDLQACRKCFFHHN